MSKYYRTEQWINFREQVIELDGGKCVLCGNSRDNGAVLQVHHKIYLRGKLPWEYAPNDCETLCKGCHAAEHGKIPPQIGWDYISETDLGDLSGTCEVCGTSYRYEFTVFHRQWGMMDVGTDCCDRLTGTVIASDAAKKRNRRKNFIKNKRWEASGSTFSIKRLGILISIHQQASSFVIQLNNHLGKKSFSNLESAKKHVFEILEDGRAKKFLNSKSKY